LHRFIFVDDEFADESLDTRFRGVNHFGFGSRLGK